MKQILFLIFCLTAWRTFAQAEGTLQWYDLAAKAAINTSLSILFS